MTESSFNYSLTSQSEDLMVLISRQPQGLEIKTKYYPFEKCEDQSIL